MKYFDFVPPTADNGYCLFDIGLENNPLVLFHTTPRSNVESIIKNGFKFGPNLASTSYAKKSSACLTHRCLKMHGQEDYAVFVVRFETLKQKGIKINETDIHVYDEMIQPLCIGYLIIPGTFQHV